MTLYPINLDEGAQRKFWANVDRAGEGCWEWTGGFFKQGYGNFFDGKHALKAHRVAWRLTNPAAPEPSVVMHKCDNPRCVRPEHLSAGTRHDNMRDCAQKGRIVTPYQKAQKELTALRAQNAELAAALRAVLADGVQDEHEAEGEGEGFILAIHVQYGDVLRARAALAKATGAQQP